MGSTTSQPTKLDADVCAGDSCGAGARDSGCRDAGAYGADACSAWSCIDDADFEQTGFSYTLSLIQGKYKMVILYCLMEFQPVRFNELRPYLKTVSDKTLSRALKELEADGLISRTAYPQIPPKVEYRLTERGASLMEVLDAMCVWGSQHRDWKPER